MVRSAKIPHSSPPIPHLRRASVKRSVVVSYLRKCDDNVRGKDIRRVFIYIYIYVFERSLG